MISSRFRAAGMAVGCLVLLAACGTASPTSTPTPSPSPTPTLEPTPTPTPTPTPSPSPTLRVPPAQLTIEGRLTICSDLAANKPQAFLDTSGEPTGSDVEIAREIGKRIDLYPVISNTPTKSLASTLAKGNCDMVISAVPITSIPAASTFAIPYFHAGQVLLVQKGNPHKIAKALDLCNGSAGAVKGSLEAAHLAGTNPYRSALGLSSNCQAAHLQTIKIVQYGKATDALAGLKAGKVGALLLTSTFAGYTVSQQADAFEVVPGVWYTNVKQGIEVSRSKPQLRNAIYGALQSMMVDGTYLKILQKYGLEMGALSV